MGKLYNIKDIIENSDLEINRLIKKIGITDNECNILYGIAKSKPFMKVEDNDYINTIICSLKDNAMRNVLETLGKTVDDIEDVEKLMIERFRNEIYNESLGIDKYVFVLDPSDDVCEVSGFENNWHMTGIKPDWAKKCIFILCADDYGEYGENEDNIESIIYIDDNFPILNTENYFGSDAFEIIKEKFPNLFKELKKCGFKTFYEYEL